jgi:Phage tail lysozyme
MPKVPRWAGRVVPAVAALGVLTVAPQIYSFVTTAPTAAAGHLATAEQISPIRVGSGPLVPRLAAADGTFRPRRGTTATSTGSSAKHASTPGAASGTAPASSGASSSHHASATAPAGHGTLTCTGTAGMLPSNYAAIVAYLTAHGYTGIAAAGIAGNIYQESTGNPESVGSGGGGLIGWTPLPAGFVTGNPAADLQTQLAALLTFNQQWSQYIPMLNAATSATQAADIYMSYFERPGIPAAGSREAAAAAVAAACGL